MSFLDYDDEIEAGEKGVVYISASRTRAIPSKMALLKWMLSVLERGHYIRKLRLSTSDGIIHEAKGSRVPADPNLQTFRRPAKSPGRPPAKKRRGETPDEKRRRQQRERQDRAREKKRMKKRTGEES